MIASNLLKCLSYVEKIWLNFSIEKIQMALNIESKAESNIYIWRVGCHEKINIVPLSQTHNK